MCRATYTVYFFLLFFFFARLRARWLIKLSVFYFQLLGAPPFLLFACNRGSRNARIIFKQNESAFRAIFQSSPRSARWNNLLSGVNNDRATRPQKAQAANYSPGIKYEMKSQSNELRRASFANCTIVSFVSGIKTKLNRTVLKRL